MDVDQSMNTGVSPLLRELRRWERRSCHAERPGRARLVTWQQDVANALSNGDAEAPRLAASLRTILRLGVASRLKGLEQLVDARRPLNPMVLAPHEAAAMRGDLDAAAGLGGRVGRHRARLATLLGTQLSAHLLWLETEAATASPERIGELLPLATGLWEDVLEVEAQGAPEVAALRERLSGLQRALETIKRAAASGREDIADLAPDVLTLASRSEGLGRSVLKAWAERLATQFADRPGWEEFVAQLRSLTHGEAGTTNVPLVPTSIGDRAGHPLLPAALAQVLDFVRDQNERTAGFLAELVSASRGEGDYPGLEMPFVTRAEIQLDWLEGQRYDERLARQAGEFSLPGKSGQASFAGLDVLEKSGTSTPPIKLRLDWVAGHDPWLQPDTLARAEAVAAQLAGQGVRLVFVRGRGVPLAQYIVGQGQRAGEFVVQGARGPVPLAGLEILQQANLVAQRPGLLHVILPPAQASGSPAGADESVRGVLDWATPSQRGSSIDLAAGGKQGEPAQPRRPGPVRVRLDWVAGADPWQKPEALEQAREAARALAASGVRLLFVRGREVPIEQYAAGTGLRSADFVVLGSRAPVSLGDVALLNEAMPVKQRPGLLHVILAPSSGQVAKALMGQDWPMLAHSEGRVDSHAERSEASPRAPRSDTVAVATMNLGPAVPPAPTGFSFATGRLMQPWGAADIASRNPSGGVSLGPLSPTAVMFRHGGPYAGFMPVGMDTVRTAGGSSIATELFAGQTTTLGSGRASLLASRLVGSGRGSSAEREASGYGLTPPPLLSHGVASLANPDTLSGTVASSGAKDAIARAKGVTATPSTSQQVRLELDWIAGQDPWQRPLALAASLRAASDLQGSGIRLEFVRGRELPPERYAADAALSAGTLGLIGPTGPVSLANLSLLDSAVLLEQRPGLLHVLLAPASISRGRSTPSGRIGMAGGLTGTIPLSLPSPSQAEPGSGRNFAGLPLTSTAASAAAWPAAAPPFEPSLAATAETHANPRLELPGIPSLGTATGDEPRRSWRGDMPTVARWFTAGGLPGLAPVKLPGPVGASTQMPGLLTQTFTSTKLTSAPGSGPQTEQSWALPLVRQLGREQLATAESNRHFASAAAQPAQTTVSTSAKSEALDGHGESGTPRTDMDALSRQIYSMIKQRLAVERERVGGRAGWRW